MKILISGAGVAGPTLAWFLAKHGFEPTIVETAPELRTGGYVIDFWGTGYDVAEKMGLLPEILRAGYMVERVQLVDDRGRPCGGFSAKVFLDATSGRYVSLSRGDLASAIWRTLPPQVETVFGDSVAALEQHGGGVRASFAHGAPRDFDLVIGADGLHSNIRELTFGAQAQFERHLGYRVAAFEAEGYRPRDELVYLSHTKPGRQIARFAMRGDKTLFLFVWVDDEYHRPDAEDLAGQKRVVHERFDDAGWECAEILAAMDKTDTLYFDRVSQIHMDRWTKGRIALLGDAASCPSLLAGEGTALAMTQAYVLAGELARAKGDHAQAFAHYEQRLRPFLARKQKAAEKFAAAFAPKTPFGVLVRNMVTRAMAIPLIAKIAIGDSLADRIELPEYP